MLAGDHGGPPFSCFFVTAWIAAASQCVCCDCDGECGCAHPLNDVVLSCLFAFAYGFPCGRSQQLMSYRNVRNALLPVQVIVERMAFQKFREGQRFAVHVFV